MARDDRKPGWLFYPAWFALTVVSFPLSWFIAFVVLRLVVDTVGGTIVVAGQRHITEDFLFLYVLLPVLGLLSGSFQYLLLRRYLPRMEWWIAATVAGWALAFVVVGILPVTLLPSLRTDTLWSVALASAFLGVTLALPQWLFLRRRVDQAAWWLVWSGIGWAAAVLLTDGAISNNQEALSLALLPPLAGSLAWWLLLGNGSAGERSRGVGSGTGAGDRGRGVELPV